VARVHIEKKNILKKRKIPSIKYRKIRAAFYELRTSNNKIAFFLYFIELYEENTCLFITECVTNRI
jgi:hypothetical protein